MCIWQFSCWYTALMSLGMMLIRANTLALGLIGKDGLHRIIQICFGNMNLVFGSEVALLGFWEYIFRILFRVYSQFEVGLLTTRSQTILITRIQTITTRGGTTQHKEVRLLTTRGQTIHHWRSDYSPNEVRLLTTRGRTTHR